MKILLLLVVGLLSGCHRSATPASSPNEHSTTGWQATRWGMTLDEIRKAVPEVTPLDKPETFERVRGHKITATFGINDFPIEGHHFIVYLLMNDNDRLEEVILHPREGEFPSIVFDTLERLLTAKYGKPNLTQGEPDHSREDDWNLSQMTITLSYEKIETLEFATLIYSKPRKEELNKL